MLQHVFDPDNIVWNYISKMVDLVLLSAIWFVCSIPIVTIGASTTALYYAVMKLSEDREGYLTADFYKSFKENFWQATRVWLLMLLSMVLIGTSAWFYLHLNSSLKMMFIPAVAVLGVVWMMVAVYCFALLSRCEVGDRQLLGMAFVMSVKNFGWTLFMIVSAGCVLAIGIFVAAPVLVICAGLIAYIHAKVLHEVFKPYQLNYEREKVEE